MLTDPNTCTLCWKWRLKKSQFPDATTIFPGTPIEGHSCNLESKHRGVLRKSWHCDESPGTEKSMRRNMAAPIGRTCVCHVGEESAKSGAISAFTATSWQTFLNCRQQWENLSGKESEAALESKAIAIHDQPKAEFGYHRTCYQRWEFSTSFPLFIFHFQPAHCKKYFPKSLTSESLKEIWLKEKNDHGIPVGIRRPNHG